MIKELDSVVLTKGLPKHGLQAGDVGWVVMVHAAGAGYEIEFVTLDGETVSVETVPANGVREARPKEITHVRTVVSVEQAEARYYMSPHEQVDPQHMGGAMTESAGHRNAKNRAAGAGGETEVPLPGGRRLDALSASGRATEVERGGTSQALKSAARRLRDAPARQHVLQVPQSDMQAAVDAMREVGVRGTVKNLAGTKRRVVRP